MTISLIAVHLWIGIWDSLIALIKKLFRIKKKNTVNWHTIDKNQISKSKADIQEVVNKVNENEQLY